MNERMPRARSSKARQFDDTDAPESVRNLWQRYRDIADRFPTDLLGAPLPYFVDWLQHRVILVEIGAPDQDMALEIFETMNDRGLRLSNTDMLKSFLLARWAMKQSIRELNERWRRSRDRAHRRREERRRRVREGVASRRLRKDPARAQGATLLPATSTSSGPRSTSGCGTTPTASGFEARTDFRSLRRSRLHGAERPVPRPAACVAADGARARGGLLQRVHRIHTAAPADTRRATPDDDDDAFTEKAHSSPGPSTSSWPAGWSTTATSATRPSCTRCSTS